MAKKKITCPQCNGSGGHLAGHNTSDSIECWKCKGSGKVEEEVKFSVKIVASRNYKKTGKPCSVWTVGEKPKLLKKFTSQTECAKGLGFASHQSPYIGMIIKGYAKFKLVDDVHGEITVRSDVPGSET